MSDTLTTRTLEPNDTEGVLVLLREALGETPLLQRTRQLFAWKHFDNPFGASIAIIAESGDRIVGLRAFMRWDLVTPEGTTVRCIRAVDTATHPDFQRRGIFRRLTEEAIEVAVAKELDLVFNTPNEKSGAGYLKMGWKHVGPVGAMVRPSPRFFHGSADPEPSMEQFIDDPVPALPLQVADRRPVGLRTPRSEAYLRWRYGSHPTARYFRADRAGSTAVLRPNVRKGRRELIIAELFGDRPGAAIRASAATSRAAYLATWFSPVAPERRAAMRNGLIPIPGLSALTLIARPLRTLDRDVFDLSSWDLAVGDLELL